VQRCRLVLNLKSVINFRIRDGEEQDAEELIEEIQRGYTPTWIEELIKRSLKFNQIEVEDYTIAGHEPAPDEELNFDY
jgi:hypothetical protein